MTKSISIIYAEVNNGDGTFGFNMDRGPSGGYWSSCIVTNPPMVMTNLVGKWTHVACVYDQAAGTSGYGVESVYFNGVLMATNEILNAPWVPNSGGPFRIGDRNYAGLLDEVAIYNYALTPAQVAQHYAVVGPPTLTITKDAGNVVVSWNKGLLLEAPSVSGPWTTNSAAVSPYTNAPAGAAKFFRAIMP